MASTGDHSGDAAVDRPDARQERDAQQKWDSHLKPNVRQKLKDTLGKLDERLRAMVDEYEVKPSAIDNTLNTAASEVSVVSEVNLEATIIEIYKTMYGIDSPLRLDSELWEEFKRQKQEFIDHFYHPALNALEIYKGVLASYNLVKGDAAPLPERGEIELIRRDNRALAEERTECIQAISAFQGKFSAMVTGLYSD